MKTQFEKLQNTINSLKNGKIKESLQILAYTGVCRTGSSSSSKGWAKKDIWTDGVCKILESINIPFEIGNDAPRGGAAGEFVKIKNGALKKAILEAMADRAATKIATAKFEKEQHDARVADVLASVPNDLLLSFYANERTKGTNIRSMAWKLSNRKGVFSSLQKFTVAEISDALRSL